MELREELEKTESAGEGWRKYMALSTAFIAVFAAIASLISGDNANEAILAKNDAILNTSKATDTWNLYQSKGLKRNLDDAFYRQTKDSSLLSESKRYALQQDTISQTAKALEAKVEEDNTRSEDLMKHHQKLALSVTLFQIAIALSAMSALLHRKSFWLISLGAAATGLTLLLVGAL